MKSDKRYEYLLAYSWSYAVFGTITEALKNLDNSKRWLEDWIKGNYDHTCNDMVEHINGYVTHTKIKHPNPELTL